MALEALSAEARAADMEQERRRLMWHRQERLNGQDGRDKRRVKGTQSRPQGGVQARETLETQQQQEQEQQQQQHGNCAVRLWMNRNWHEHGEDQDEREAERERYGGRNDAERNQESFLDHDVQWKYDEFLKLERVKRLERLGGGCREERWALGRCECSDRCDIYQAGSLCWRISGFVQCVHLGTRLN
jgi:hypothetical protein